MALVGFGCGDAFRLSYRLDAVILGHTLSSATSWRARWLRSPGRLESVGSLNLGGAARRETNR